jgi:protein SCO1/2
MNRRAMIKPVAKIAALCAPMLLVACNAAPPATQPLAGTSLEGAAIGGDFSLVDKDGKAVRWADFRGSYTIVYFGYTFCPDACPADVAVLMRGFAQFEKAEPDKAARVRPVFISIDPARDTPKVVGEFAAAFSPRLLGLTGSQAEVDQAAKAFKTYAAKGQQSAGGYLMDHTRFAYLMDPDGKPIEALPIDKSAEAVAADLRAAVK